MTTDQTEDRTELVPPNMLPIMRDIAGLARDHGRTAAELVLPMDAQTRETLGVIVTQTAARAVAILAALEAVRINDLGTVPRG